MKHNEGPWTVEVYDNHTDIESKYYTIACDVANCDADLIAAAPDLLDALKWFKAVTEAALQDADSDASLKDIEHALERATAAISKAEGRQS